MLNVTRVLFVIAEVARHGAKRLKRMLLQEDMQQA
jgi:hypothetical protein